MDQNDRQIIEDLFAKLSEAERSAPERDRDAEALIRERIGRHPDAPYYMLQTIAVQQQALEALQERVSELERRGTGGFLGGLFGLAPAASRPAGPRMPVHGPRQGAQSSPWERPRQGDFMAGAMQTAVGVAGGVLLGNALAGMLAPDEAVAEEPAPEDDMDLGSNEEL